MIEQNISEEEAIRIEAKAAAETDGPVDYDVWRDLMALSASDRQIEREFENMGFYNG